MYIFYLSSSWLSNIEDICLAHGFTPDRGTVKGSKWLRDRSCYWVVHQINTQTNRSVQVPPSDLICSKALCLSQCASPQVFWKSWNCWQISFANSDVLMQITENCFISPVMSNGRNEIFRKKRGFFVYRGFRRPIQVLCIIDVSFHSSKTWTTAWLCSVKMTLDCSSAILKQDLI